MNDEKYNNHIHDQKVRKARTKVIKAAFKWKMAYNSGDYESLKSDQARINLNTALIELKKIDSTTDEE